MRFATFLAEQERGFIYLKIVHYYRFIQIRITAPYKLRAPQLATRLIRLLSGNAEF